MGDFEVPYLDIDEAGYKYIKCLKCGYDVVRRHYLEIDIRSIPPERVKVLALQRLGNYALARVVLADGTYADIPMCKGCNKNFIVDIEQDPDTSEKIRVLLVNGLVREKEHALQSELEIARFRKLWKDKKVLRGLDRKKDNVTTANLAYSIAKEYNQKEKDKDKDKDKEK